MHAASEALSVGRWSIDFRAVLGHGAFGRVYKAHDAEGGEDVAAKVIAATGVQLTKIQDEVRLLGRVTQHDNIIGLRGAQEIAAGEAGHSVVIFVRSSPPLATNAKL